MARPNKDFLTAWVSLDGAEVESGWRSIPIDPAGPICIQVGRRFPGNEESILFHFTAASVPTRESLPDGQGFSVERADPHEDGALWLALTRRPNGSADFFTLMACDVVGVLDGAATAGDDHSKMARVFLGRVRAWQEFMRKGTQILGPEAEIGLMGELAILSLIINADVPSHAAMESWMGPLDGIQDFELGTGAIEVKATISAVGFSARIGSLEQLDDAVRQPLYVAGVRLKQTATGDRLPDVVKTLRGCVASDAEASRVLEDRLVAAGYFDGHADKYIRRFEISEIQVVEVGPEFPRLLKATIPSGVTRANYEIDFGSAAQNYVGDFSEALKKLGAI